jgi:hypothetical protein
MSVYQIRAPICPRMYDGRPRMTAPTASTRTGIVRRVAIAPAFGSPTALKNVSASSFSVAVTPYETMLAKLSISQFQRSTKFSSRPRPMSLVTRIPPSCQKLPAPTDRSMPQ